MEGLRARVERRASRGVWFGYRTGQGYALKVEAPIQRRRAHLARADDFTTRETGQLCLGRLRARRRPRSSRRLIWACVGFFHESHKKYKKFEHVEHLLKVVGSRVVPTNEASYGAKGFIDSGVLVAKQFIWVVSEELEYSEMWDEGSIGANVIYTEFGEACVLEVTPDNRGLRGSGVMKLQIDVPLARANDFLSR